MSDQESQLRQEMSRGARVRAIMEDGILEAAFETLRASYLKRWEECPDPEQRDRFWQGIQVLRLVRSDLLSTIETGKLASLQLANPTERRLDA